MKTDPSKYALPPLAESVAAFRAYCEEQGVDYDALVEAASHAVSGPLPTGPVELTDEQIAAWAKWDAECAKDEPPTLRLPLPEPEFTVTARTVEADGPSPSL
ncbi:hypothetical protein [Alienimonas sp. DA493]|uniref:hypothetical protein n=1 Tax=Alienimonas sp. DA493 TaxID=3373605 RepID=UPI0037546056